MTVGNDLSCNHKMKSEDENEIVREFNDVFEGSGSLGAQSCVNRRISFLLRIFK